jgi:predicted DCC family thiol-disulfide oxidoreductase YuxK
MKDRLYFDGACGMCRAGCLVLASLDWFNALEFADLSTHPGLGVSAEDLARKGVPMRTRDGEVIIGLPAIRRALLRTPLCWPTGILLHVPGIAWVARKLYLMAVRKRARVVVCLVGGIDAA